MTLTLSIKRVRHLEYTEEIYRTEFPYSDNYKLSLLNVCANEQGRQLSRQTTVTAPGDPTRDFPTARPTLYLTYTDITMFSTPRQNQ